MKLIAATASSFINRNDHHVSSPSNAHPLSQLTSFVRRVISFGWVIKYESRPANSHKSRLLKNDLQCDFALPPLPVLLRVDFPFLCAFHFHFCLLLWKLKSSEVQTTKYCATICWTIRTSSSRHQSGLSFAMYKKQGWFESYCCRDLLGGRLKVGSCVMIAGNACAHWMLMKLRFDIHSRPFKIN